VFDFRNLLHRDGTVYNTVTPEELTKQPEVRVCGVCLCAYLYVYRDGST